MMGNGREKFTIKQLEKALIKENENDPRIFEGRRSIAVVWYGILAFRIVILVLYVLSPNGPRPSALDLGFDLFTTFLAWIFMMAAYKMGVKNANYLPVVGGLITLSNVLKIHPFLLFPYISFQQKILIILMLIMGLWQTFGLLFIIFSKKTNIFFKACKNIDAESENSTVFKRKEEIL